MKSGHRPRVASVGTGIAGLSCAWALRDIADLTLFESNNRPGGHTNTVNVEEEGRIIPIDTGFIVFNKVTYPNLCRLFEELGVRAKPSEMSFSVQQRTRGLEYNGMGLNKLFAQRSNIFNPRFLALIAEIMRFFRIGRKWLEDEADGDCSGKSAEDLATFCRRHNFSPDFLELYLVPMSSAVWSTEPGLILEFPAATLLHFFHNHGFLGVNTHHPWFTVDGGARTYVDKMIRFLGEPRFGDPVVSVEESMNETRLLTASGMRGSFDIVILATHADESLRILKTPSPEQVRLLSAFGYQTNEAQLHTDSSVMPRRKLAWASWNFSLEDNPERHRRASTHYWMNALQNVSKERDYFVSLNSSHLINPMMVLHKCSYNHPVFTLAAMRAQRELPSLNRTGGIFFCGSYFRHGFHEDACASGLAAAKAVINRLKER